MPAGHLHASVNAGASVTVKLASSSGGGGAGLISVYAGSSASRIGGLPAVDRVVLRNCGGGGGDGALLCLYSNWS